MPPADILSKTLLAEARFPISNPNHRRLLTTSYSWLPLLLPALPAILAC